MGDLAFLNINPEDEVKGGSFEPIPQGEYHLLIEDAEVKRTKSGTGSYLSLRFQVLDGDFAGRILFDNVTIMHDNQQAVDIGKEKLILLARFTRTSGKDSAEFLNKTIKAKVKIKPANGQYEASNAISYYTGSVGSSAGPANKPGALGSTREVAGVKATVVHRTPDQPAPVMNDDDSEPPF